MTISHRRILDQIQYVKDRFGHSPLTYQHPVIEREAVLNMQFRKGDHVHDRATGQTGVIVAGYRRSFPQVPAP